MSFYATRFSFDGIPSETHSLRLYSTNPETSTTLPGDIKIYGEKLFKRTDFYFYGASIDPMLEFPVTFITDNDELTAKDLEQVSSWLFGRSTYGELRIIQPDMQDVYFECFLSDPKIYRVANIIRGVSATVKCRHPWGLTKVKSYTHTFTPNASNAEVRHFNGSDHSGYTFPILELTVDAFGGDFSITNTSDSNRVFTFTGLQSNEIVTVNNSLQIITSSTGLRRLSNFNKSFFRLVQGLNVLTVDGNITGLKISYAQARKIGG